MKFKNKFLFIIFFCFCFFIFTVNPCFGFTITEDNDNFYFQEENFHKISFSKSNADLLHSSEYNYFVFLTGLYKPDTYLEYNTIILRVEKPYSLSLNFSQDNLNDYISSNSSMWSVIDENNNVVDNISIERYYCHSTRRPVSPSWGTPDDVIINTLDWNSGVQNTHTTQDDVFGFATKNISYEQDGYNRFYSYKAFGSRVIMNFPATEESITVFRTAGNSGNGNSGDNGSGGTNSTNPTNTTGGNTGGGGSSGGGGASTDIDEEDEGVLSGLGNILKNVFRSIFIPEDGWFEGQVNNLKSDLDNHFHFSQYISDLQSIKDYANSYNSNSSVTTYVNLPDYRISDSLSVRLNRFIDFSFISEHRQTWFNWVRVFFYPFFIFFNLNSLSKLLNGHSIFNENNNSNDKGGGKN